MFCLTDVYSKKIVNDYTMYFVIGLIREKMGMTLTFRVTLNLLHLLN